uniref:Uncharacterized protein n=1 Tax=Anopheles atroparvus TaxID=41427 RepID=A0A182JKP2_ANOAO
MPYKGSNVAYCKTILRRNKPIVPEVLKYIWVTVKLYYKFKTYQPFLIDMEQEGCQYRSVRSTRSRPHGHGVKGVGAGYTPDGTVLCPITTDNEAAVSERDGLASTERVLAPVLRHCTADYVYDDNRRIAGPTVRPVTMMPWWPFKIAAVSYDSASLRISTEPPELLSCPLLPPKVLRRSLRITPTFFGGTYAPVHRSGGGVR